MKTKQESRKVSLRRRALLKMALCGAAILAAGPLGAGAQRLPARPLYWGEGVRSDVRLYVRRCYDYALALQEQYRLPTWGTLAVAILESGVGTSELAKQANNHFGIKALRGTWKGRLYCKEEEERGPGNLVRCTYYRAYDSVEEGYGDFADFLQHPRYAALRYCGPTDFVNWCTWLKAAGYATDPDYVHKLLYRIGEYRLDQLNYLRPEPIQRV